MLRLYCVLDGTSDLFPVDIDPSKEISDLKEAIHEKKKNTFNSLRLDADQLVIWPVYNVPTRRNPLNLNSLTLADQVITKDPDDDQDVPSFRELDPSWDIEYVFGNGSQPFPRRTIQIIVQLPQQTTSISTTGLRSPWWIILRRIWYSLFTSDLWKQSVSEAFPNGLPYQPPCPLLRTRGSSWIYQPDPALYGILRNEISEHFEHFIAGEQDKTTIPLYLFLSGAGTGKSRNAQEFHHSAYQCLAGHDPLRTRIENAWVFHVSLENGTSPMENEPTVRRAIANRMLLQLMPDSTVDTIAALYLVPDPKSVLQLIAKHTGQDLESAVFILVVDGVQCYMSDPNDGRNKDSIFYRSLTSIGDLALGGLFSIVCCTATVTAPVDQVLAFTHRKRIFLPVASLNPPSIYENGVEKQIFKDDYIMNLLLGDCGGHGRAIESLQEVIDKEGGIDNCNIDTLMHSLFIKLKDRYSEAYSLGTTIAVPIARAVLSRAILDPNTQVRGTGRTPVQLAIPGLVRYMQLNGPGSMGYLTAPYIWVWLFSYQSVPNLDPALRDWRFSDYSDLRSRIDSRLPPGAQFWQNFERFVVSFRCLKSWVLDDDEITTISTIHSGARLGDDDFVILNRRLVVAVASSQVDTKSTSHDINSWLVQADHGNVQMADGRHCIVNAASAPFGDSFLGLLGQDSQPLCTEVHQCEHVEDSNSINYIQERSKAASERDFFILYSSSARLELDLPPRSGVVDQSNWESYFGPFAGRAFVYATTGALDINQASRRDLMRISGIGEVEADLILTERQNGNFIDVDDAVRRLRGVGRNVLNNFKYPRE
ncbi:hypothetical protein BGZ76_003497 [Entomortierella beljakovae]|nr:hypothetical protein BGZ76_003497 [Entomortierella beljakovae]